MSVHRFWPASQRMEVMACPDCGHEWRDLDAATSQYATRCPSCNGWRTDPAYDLDGRTRLVAAQPLNPKEDPK